MKLLISFLTAAVLALGLSACGTSTNGTTPDDLFGAVTWQLTGGSVDATPLQPISDAPVTLAAVDSQIGGRAACNSYGAEMTFHDGEITIGMIIATEMACEPAEIMTLEAAYLGGLQRVTTATRLSETRLTLNGEGVTLQFSTVAISTVSNSPAST
jgi:heat shock protein HslJ